MEGIFAHINKNLENYFGNHEKGSLCKIIKVWLNYSINDVYVQIEFNDDNTKMITSISDIDWQSA